jgi:hypothetical protein
VHRAPTVNWLKVIPLRIRVEQIRACALGVVLCYYGVESSRPVFQTVQGWKQSGGLLFAAIATIISGGVIPECIKRIAATQASPTHEQRADPPVHYVGLTRDSHRCILSSFSAFAQAQHRSPDTPLQSAM